jgi:hypothetical protein
VFLRIENLQFCVTLLARNRDSLGAKQRKQMQATTENQAEEAFAFIKSSLAQGKNVYVSTGRGVFRTSPALASKGEAAGKPFFRLKDGKLLMRSGRNSVTLAIPELRFVSISASPY